MASLLKPGQTLAGYEIIEQVGKGGMGEVYRARQISMDRIVALKILSPKLVAKDPAFTERFVAEARAAGRLNHANIIGVHDVGETTLEVDGKTIGIHYFSMEFVRGETVKDIIERRGLMPLDDVARIMIAMAEALVYAEAQKVVHRDIKPENIMVSETGDVKLADLGLAEQVSDEVADDPDPKARKVMGTPMYMSPEQARGLTVGHASDQYSLGATLFHMLTGRAPYVGKDAKSLMRAHVLEPIPDPQELRDDLSPAWCQLCMRLMAKDPAQRYARAADLRTAVSAAVVGAGSPAQSRRSRAARSTGGHAPVRRPSSSSQVGLFIGIGVVAAALGGWVLFGRGGSRPQRSEPAPVAEPAQAPTTDPSLAAARRLIEGLGTDAAAAIAALDQGLADTSLSPAARDLLVSERRRRDDQARQAEAEAAKALAGRIAALRGELAQNHYFRVQQGLKELPAQDGAVIALAADLDKAVGTALDAIRARIAEADAELLDTLASRAKVLAPLRAEDPRIDEIGRLIQERRDALAAAAAAAAAKAEEEPRWRALARTIDQQRYAASYASAQAAIDQDIAALASQDSRDRAAPLAELGTLAGKAEGWLRNHCRSRSPTVPLRIGDVVRKATIVALDDDAVQLKPSGGATTRIPRHSAAVDWIALLDAAMAALPADVRADGDRHRLAFAAFWDPAAAGTIAKGLGGTPLAKAYLELDRRRPLPRLAVPWQREANAVAYEFLPGDPRFFADFTTQDPCQPGESGMVWRPAGADPGNTLKEAALPTLAWKAKLRPPCRYDLRVRLNPQTKIAFFGVEVEGRRFRIAQSNPQQTANLTLFPVVPGGDDKFSVINALSQAPARYGGASTIVLQVDASGRMTASFDGQTVDSAREVGTGPVGLVIQIFQNAPGGWIEIESLTASGAAVVP